VFELGAKALGWKMTGRLKIANGLIAVLFLSAPAVYSAEPGHLAGSIAGIVRDSTGIPQMGATVLLFNRSERLMLQTITNERGIFGFDLLSPDLYSVRVSLASFVPAVKQKIAVQPGMQSLLYVDLASVLSSIELVYVAPGQGALMSDDWKWTLKSSAATRPVLRILPGQSASDPNQRDTAVGSIFGDTHGLLSVSGGDPGSLGGSSAQTDLGTAFAVATSVLGRDQLLFSGNLGYNAAGGTPGGGFRTSYNRGGGGLEVAVTMQQVFLPARANLGEMNGDYGPAGPALRTVAISMKDTVALADNLHLDYGMSLNSVSFLDHLNYMSRFARLDYDLGKLGTLQFAVSSGAPPTQLLVDDGRGDETHVGGDQSALAEDLAALSVLPRLSLLDGRGAVEESQNVEIGYEKKLRSTRLNVTGYRETITNADMTMASPAGNVFAMGDVLPDISSNSGILNIGSFQRTGFAASVSQTLGSRLEIGSSAGRGGALELANQGIAIENADQLRASIHNTDRFWASARASATLPGVGTQISASYEWTDYSTIMPSHFYLTQSTYPEPGLNIRVRQPIPSFAGIPGRLEATAELRNGLAQGYIPITADAQQVILVQQPRVLRGGLSFIF
jgi:hypothetical protein